MLWKTTRLIVYIAIILFWAGMMTLLFIREGYFSKSSWSFPQKRWEEPKEWVVGLYTNDDKRIGFIQTWTQPDQLSPYGPAFKLNLLSRLETVIFSTPVKLSIDGFAWFSEKKGLENFQLTFRSEDIRIMIYGEYNDQQLKGKIITGKEEIPYSIPVGKNVLLAGGPALPLMDTPVLEPGQSISVDVFDPLSMSTQKAIITSQGKELLHVIGEEVETYRMTVTLGGLTSTIWVTPDQDLIQAHTPFGLKLKKISTTEALNTRPEDTGNLIVSTAIKPKGVKPFRGAKQMWVKIDGISETNPLPTSPYQVCTPQGYFISPPVEVKSVPLTEKLIRDIPPNTLSGDAFVQVEHPKIKQLAQEIVGNEQDLWIKSKKIFDWVYNNIEKKITINIPSALSVLESKQGDCNEHTVLFTALARAVGIPTRVCLGLVWSDELQAFGYHAWAEVFVGDWIPIDPTLNQLIADATHIKLLHGNIEQWTHLSSYMNQIQLEITYIE
ncbi:MAG: transglutaminase-like domain-containing protein [Candidatus Hydrogenedens sp.]|nr:transglutaminase-like domain-containing protein [Candidatus Hydrogenedens sp.]